MKTILLAVSGSIAFYKSYELISLFKKEGFRVKVLLSKGLLKFASRLSFEALADAVLCEANESWQNYNNHIAFSKDADLVLFAPASVNSINKLANGIADTLFIQTLMAAKAPIIIAPAANSAMYL
ncbi:flavoprotein, partial [Campylobacter upsaliensis]